MSLKMSFKRCSVGFLLAFLSSCSAVSEPIEIGVPLPSSAFVYWSDADSGHIRGITEPIHFRLHDVDAPETRSPNQRGGARCEAERPLGYAAKEFIVAFSKNSEITITRNYGEDHYDRQVIDLSLNGQDVASALIKSGHGKIWDYDGGQLKPDWCT